ncbi:hypothetical protein TWF694_001965 [Orbilia ellipsospora]|uniref:Major facilitator superfamily (MFS) profile domain-containing protein n=1 Tax=Orbilia ellipsospora TaxID=2528407 RepID=A0AAV9XAC6_9PEZI
MALNPHHDPSRLKGANTATFEIATDTPTQSSAPIESKKDLGELQSIAETEDQKILRKRIDWAILPVLVLCYFLLFTNRTNVQLVYLSDDPRYPFTKNHYAIVQFVFALSYSLPEPVWNVLLRRVGPRVWLAPALFLSGLIAIFCAFVQDWQALAGLRFLIGIPLGALFPGCLYYITCWYPRRQLGRPISIFYSGATLGSAFANLLNSAILQIDTGEKYTSGWKVGSDWVVIIWGLITIVASVIIFFAIPDFPDEDNRILKSAADHAAFRAWYVASDVTRKISEQYRPHAWKQGFSDMKTLLFILVQLTTVIPRDGLAIMQRQIAVNLASKLDENASITIQTLLYVPPVALAFIVTVTVGILSDRTNQRGYYMMAFSIFSICGFAILLATTNATAQYVAGFLAYVGTWVCGALCWVWLACNCEGLYKRAIVIGLAVGMLNLSSGLTVPATVILHPYENGVSRVGGVYFLALVCLHLCVVALTRFYLLDQNKKKKALGNLPQDATQYSGPNGLPIEDKGDKRSDFEYLL